MLPKTKDPLRDSKVSYCSVLIPKLFASASWLFEHHTSLDVKLGKQITSPFLERAEWDVYKYHSLHICAVSKVSLYVCMAHEKSSIGDVDILPRSRPQFEQQ